MSITTTFAVTGMSCEHCVAAVTREVTALPAVTGVDVDLAAGTSSAERAQGRTATAAVSHLIFLSPVKVGDVVCVHTEVTRVGRTSLTIAVEAWAKPRGGTIRHKVTAAEFVMVAVDDHGKPRPVPAEQPAS